MNTNKLNINFLVDKQILKRLDRNILVSDSVNYLNATFRFTEDWKGTKKQVYIRNRYGYCQLYDLPESNVLSIPSEFIIRKGFVIAIKGSIENKVVIATKELVVDVVSTVDFDEALKEWLLSSTLSLSREGTTYTADIPDTFVSYDENTDVIHFKKLDDNDLTTIQLPHKENISKLEDWTQDSFDEVDVNLDELSTRINNEISNRKSLSGHSIKVSQAKPYTIDIDLINALGIPVSHQEISLDTAYLIDSTYLDYNDNKLIFVFKSGRKIECDLTEMIKDFQDGIIKVNNRIDALDYYNTKSDGEYLDGITQTGGLISVTKRTFDTELSDDSVIAPQSKVVKSYVDKEITRATTKEEELEDSISSTTSDITSKLNSEISRATTKENLIVDNLNNINAKIDGLDYSSSNTTDRTIVSLTQTDGLINATYKNIQISQYQVNGLVSDLETIKRDISTESADRLDGDSATLSQSKTYTETKVNTVQEEIDDINSKISTQASKDNQLADKDFVNSSIATATATFRGTVNTLEALKALTGDDNDYAFYKHTDSSGNTIFDRYKYSTSSSTSSTTGNWEYEYTLNNSSFTAAQWSAVNSGITATLVTQITTNKNNITTEITNRQAGDIDTLASAKTYADELFATTTEVTTMLTEVFDG